MRKIRKLIAAVFLSLTLFGCENRSIEQRLVVSSMTLDLTETPWKVRLEILKEEENLYLSVTGSRLSEIGSHVEAHYGYPIYWGAMESVAVYGVRDGEEMKSLLLMLADHPQLSRNLQIALCKDPENLLNEKHGGQQLAALLTAHYARSHDYSLCATLGGLLSEETGNLIPMVEEKEDQLIIEGFVPSHSGDYSEVWQGNMTASMLLGQLPKQTKTVKTEEGGAEILFKKMGTPALVRGKRGETRLLFSLTAAVESTERPGMSRESMENAIRSHIFEELEEMRRQVMEKGKTDFLGVGRLSLWWDDKTPPPEKIPFSLSVTLQDPKELLRK